MWGRLVSFTVALILILIVAFAVLYVLGAMINQRKVLTKGVSLHGTVNLLTVASGSRNPTIDITTLGNVFRNKGWKLS